MSKSIELFCYPIRRSSICKSISVSENNNVEEKKNKTEEVPQVLATSTPVETITHDDRNLVKNVLQERRRFQELRRCMQTEEEDEPEAGAQLAAPMEHPFKIISHDTMSLQSMTSLGRIGRILSGAAESHPNIRDSALGASAARGPLHITEDPILIDRTQNVEPDVIASTKANSLKVSRAGSVVSVSAPRAGPVAPPRRRKRSE